MQKPDWAYWFSSILFIRWLCLILETKKGKVMFGSDCFRIKQTNIYPLLIQVAFDKVLNSDSWNQFPKLKSRNRETSLNSEGRFWFKQEESYVTSRFLRNQLESCILFE